MGGGGVAGGTGRGPHRRRRGARWRIWVQSQCPRDLRVSRTSVDSDTASAREQGLALPYSPEDLILLGGREAGVGARSWRGGGDWKGSEGGGGEARLAAAAA